jgi:hypothetical protein
MGFDPVIPISTVWKIDHIRNGKVVDSWFQGNALTDQGLNHMLDVTFHGGVQISPWRIALFSDDISPLASNTYALPGYTEFTAYSESQRPSYVELPAAERTLSNIANRAVFTINTAATLYGLSLVGGPTAMTKGDIDAQKLGSVLFCVSRFAEEKVLLVSDILMVSCTISLEDV